MCLIWAWREIVGPVVPALPIRTASILLLLSYWMFLFIQEWMSSR